MLPTLFVLTILIFSLGFFLSSQVVGYPYIAENNPPDVANTATGLASLILNLLGAALQPLFAWFIHGVRGNVDFTMAWLFLIGCFIVALGTSFTLNKVPIGHPLAT
ncbi:hypothetical protein [Facilibium subflavum]|uniref:hypothetical protein n=1 Tax=Facilibium subflavum TaxID=2219058 RepID=UPI000E64A20A|nr:hypothetical protein [Facilibium subflavum]